MVLYLKRNPYSEKIIEQGLLLCETLQHTLCYTAAPISYAQQMITWNTPEN